MFEDDQLSGSGSEDSGFEENVGREGKEVNKGQTSVLPAIQE